jgi:hypothetical protein
MPLYKVYRPENGNCIVECLVTTLIPYSHKGVLWFPIYLYPKPGTIPNIAEITSYRINLSPFTKDYRGAVSYTRHH